MADPSPTSARFDGLVDRVAALVSLTLDEARGPILASLGGFQGWLAKRVVDAVWPKLHAHAPVMAERAVDAVYETWGRYSVADLMRDLENRLHARGAVGGFFAASDSRLLNELRALTTPPSGLRIYPDPCARPARNPEPAPMSDSNQNPNPTCAVEYGAGPEHRLMAVMTAEPVPHAVAAQLSKAVADQAAANGGDWVGAVQQVLGQINTILGPASPYVGAATGILQALLGLYQHLYAAPAANPVV
jgi:hypothetical protein